MNRHTRRTTVIAVIVALLAELDAALKQFPTIKGSFVRLNGDVPAFSTWLQLGPRRC